MQQFSSYNRNFYDVAYENYSYLKVICETIEKEGYYEQPEKLLKQTIYETLDVYIEAVLAHFCMSCSRLDVTSRQFIKSLLTTEMIPISVNSEWNEEESLTINRVVAAPPILLQLCGLYDYERSKELSSLFLDRVLSILLALASINHGKNMQALYYVQQYYEKMINFVNVDQVERRIPRRYLFKKISSDMLIKLEDMNIVMTMNHKKTEITHETTNVTKTELEQENMTANDENSKLEQLLEELNSLIGLETVKEQITSLINVIKVRKLRESYNMPLTKLSYHMVFSGNPGTGKTTVARLVAKIYKELGIVEKGTFVETDRSGLVAGYVGQTAIKVTEVVTRALGGVLFIDEAYSLTNTKISNDFGSEAVDALVKLMEDHRDDLVVIVAGYKEEMQEFLKSNTGLISRFNTFVEFQDYTCSELIEILKSFAEKNEMKFSEEAMRQITKQLMEQDVVHSKEFGNARGIRNLFERILVRQANRLVTYKTLSKDEISTIELYDVIKTS
ncbi:MAG: AAA family ATPase [bacterium]|nr:AAA family ATPase [bacterium]